MTLFHPEHIQLKRPAIDFKLDQQKFRRLTPSEIDILRNNQNTAEDWQSLFVSEKFYPERIKNCSFAGTLYLETNPPGVLEQDNLFYTTGIYNSHIKSCHIGTNCSINNVSILSNYRVEENCILQNIQQLSSSAYSTFGCGYQNNNSKPGKRNWLKVANENGGRALLPFTGMLPSDAYLWTRFGHEPSLKKRLIALTDMEHKKNGNFVPTVGKHSIIRNCATITDVFFGSHCTIIGANYLDNLTILSNAAEPTFIGSGTDLRTGIVGFQNSIDSNTIAENFLTGKNVTLKYNAKLVHSFVGDNSTIACAEVLNNLIFPFHEQHHTNSFLIATILMGQSNIAAGATIGSNHNSRAADGEIVAGRGFWPGLVSNFKHNSKFASFTLAAKGNYDSELNITLPFALISPAGDPANIRIFPGFWFKYNLYALARNSWKFEQRDKRKIKTQVIETDFLAPDTIEEMFAGIELLIGSLNAQTSQSLSLTALRENKVTLDKKWTLLLDGQVNKGKAEVYKPVQSILLYRDMILFYSVRAILDNFPKTISTDAADSTVDWINLGGQIIPSPRVKSIIDGIRDGQIDSWEAVHTAYAKAQTNYSNAKYDHALHTLQRLAKMESFSLDSSGMHHILDEFQIISKQLLDWAFESRRKDYTSPFRTMVYETPQETEAVLGKIEDNPFLADYQKTMQTYIHKAAYIKNQID